MPTAILFALKSLGIKVLWTLVTEKMLEWMFFKAAEGLVAHTETKHDDEWLAKFKEEYKKTNG